MIMETKAMLINNTQSAHSSKLCNLWILSKHFPAKDT